MSYFNASLKKISPENLGLSFGKIELIFVTFLFLEQRGWKVRNEEKAGKSNSKVQQRLNLFWKIFKGEDLLGNLKQNSLFPLPMQNEIEVQKLAT